VIAVPQSRTPHGIGLYLGAVQFLFAATWVVYVIYLPQLARQVGLDGRAVLAILLADQAIFALMDVTMGVAADRVARVVGRLGKWVVALTVVSCAAALAMPFVVRDGESARGIFLALIVVWTATSSALRAPPLVLLGRHAPASTVPWLASLSMLGLGVAFAAAPYLAVTLRGMDPRLPFAVATLSLAAATLGIVWAERRLSAATPAAAPVVTRAPGGGGAAILAFLVGIVLLGIGFQVNFGLNSAPRYLRFATPGDLPYLMPVFWIGFNLAVLPAGALARRLGGMTVVALAAVLGALALYASAMAGGLEMLVAAQFVAGASWGAALASALAAALALGRTGREGLVSGALFSLLAVATFLRIGVVATEFNQVPMFKQFQDWLPMLAWSLAGALLVILVVARHPTHRISIR
jgi:hypothetical protein